MSRIERSYRAQIDVQKIWVYVAERNYAAADRLIDEFDESLSLLSRHPYMGEAVAELQPGVRRLVVNSYLLFYEPLENGIRLLRVFHSSRRIQSLLDD